MGIPILAMNVIENESLALQAIIEGARDYLVKGKVTSAMLQESILFAIERKKMEIKLVRRASFAQGNSNAIIEISGGGEIIYANPAALEQFPELRAGDKRRRHPFIKDLKAVVESMQKENKEVMIRDVCLQEKIYEQQISYVADSGAVRTHITDMAERKKSDNEFKARTAEM